MDTSDVVITGIGLVSSIGEGVEAHWQALSDPAFRPRVDARRFAPYPIHPLAPVDWDRQIPKRGDQRQMEPWQRTGVYAAGLALEDAGLKGDEALCSTMDMIVAAGGGERDDAVDRAVLAAAPRVADAGVLLNEKLTTELRPTLFLAQLSNLLAGNISIVHKVTGSSQTFMGEEAAGISALQTAVARISAGQASHMLVGGAFNCEHPEFLLLYEVGGRLLRGPWLPVWQRGVATGGGVVLGSAGVFLVLEATAHAKARGAKAYARLGRVAAGSAKRGPEYAGRLAGMIAQVDPKRDGARLVVSGASGATGPTTDERAALDAAGGMVARVATSRFGHVKEAQFPLAVAVAAIAASKRAAPAPLDAAEEGIFGGDAGLILATTVGYHRGEGMARVEAVPEGDGRA
ncbi:MAG: beta-ketoacyl-ACP synthase [Rhizobiaceae bacterium]|nr:beta-ketoacyl-ACP synthase [Rhizobiaceae bacterium]